MLSLRADIYWQRLMALMPVIEYRYLVLIYPKNLSSLFIGKSLAVIGTGTADALLGITINRAFDE